MRESPVAWSCVSGLRGRWGGRTVGVAEAIAEFRERRVRYSPGGLQGIYREWQRLSSTHFPGHVMTRKTMSNELRRSSTSLQLIQRFENSGVPVQLSARIPSLSEQPAMTTQCVSPGRCLGILIEVRTKSPSVKAGRRLRRLR